MAPRRRSRGAPLPPPPTRFRAPRAARAHGPRAPPGALRRACGRSGVPPNRAANPSAARGRARASGRRTPRDDVHRSVAAPPPASVPRATSSTRATRPGGRTLPSNAARRALRAVRSRGRNPAAVRDGNVRREIARDHPGRLRRPHTNLPHVVAKSNRDVVVLRRFRIDRDAERRARLVLAAIAPADRAGLVVEHGEPLPQVIGDGVRHLRLPVLLGERKHTGLHRRERRMEAHHDTSFLLTSYWLLPVRVHEQRQQRAIRPAGGLDHERQVTLFVRLIDVLEPLSREFLMLAEVEVAAIVDAFDLLRSEGTAEIEFDVERGAGVVGQFPFPVLMELQPRLVEPEPAVPGHAGSPPLLEPLHIGAGLDEELHLHLLEFARAEDEIPRRDFVAECLPDLRDAERHFLPRRLLHVEEIHVRSLGRFGTQVDRGGGVFHRAHVRLEHQVKLTRLRQLALAVLARLLARLPRAVRVLQLVGAKAALAEFAVHERIDEPTDVPARLPHARMHKDRGIETLDVVARAHHRVPPALLQVALQLDAERTVVPDGAKAAVDLGGLKNEPTPLGERHEFFHEIGEGHESRETGAGGRLDLPVISPGGRQTSTIKRRTAALSPDSCQAPAFRQPPLYRSARQSVMRSLSDSYSLAAVR